MERHTRQRQAVLEALAGSGRTLSPPEILALAQHQAPRLNLSTVYRQIKALEERGEVVKVQLPGLPARFEARCGQPEAVHAPGHGAPVRRPGSVAERGQPVEADHLLHHHHHHHFHCLLCDQVVPIHGCPGPMHELAPQGCLVERHDLVLHGRCAACATEATA